MIKVLLPAWLLPWALLAQETPPAGVLLLHAAPHAVLNDRPYIVDFIVQFGSPPEGPVHDDAFDFDTMAADSTGSFDSTTADITPSDSMLAEWMMVDSADIAEAIALESAYKGPAVESVALFYRTNTSLTFKELPMQGSYNRYQATIEKIYLTNDDTLTYFFTVTTGHYRLWGYPISPSGKLQPIVRLLVPPSREYFRREFRGRP